MVVCPYSVIISTTAPSKDTDKKDNSANSAEFSDNRRVKIFLRVGFMKTTDLVADILDRPRADTRTATQAVESQAAVAASRWVITDQVFYHRPPNRLKRDLPKSPWSYHYRDRLNHTRSCYPLLKTYVNLFGACRRHCLCDHITDVLRWQPSFQHSG